MNIQKPVLPDILKNPVCWIQTAGELRSILEFFWESEKDITMRVVKGVTMEEADFSDSSWRSVIFENCQFQNCDFTKSQWMDARFRSCDFSNSDFSGTSLVRVEMLSCKGMGLRMMESGLQHVLWQNCNFQYANIHHSVLKSVCMKNGDLSNGELSECRLQNLRLDDMRLLQTSFFQTPLKGIDFTASQIDGMVVSGPELKGAIVDQWQAAGLARLLGLIIKD